MKVVPAMDLMGGKVVRLKEGKRDQVTVYSDDPPGIAAGFAREGADLLHVVDLDGAFAGRSAQAEIFARLELPLQIGGGLRTRDEIEAVLALGARYVVLGTAAIAQPALVEDLCREHRDAIVVAVDAKDGMVAIEGWTKTSSMPALELAQRAADWGAAKILYTDVARDGMRTGPNVFATGVLQRALGAVPVIASGGIGSLADIRALAGAGVAECVVGRALYDRVFTLSEARAAC